MGLRKDCMPGREEPIRVGKAPSVRASSYAYLTGNNQLRKLRTGLRDWADGGSVTWAEIQKSVRKLAPELSQAVECVLEAEHKPRGTCPFDCRQFFIGITTDYPISTLIPPELALPTVVEPVCALERILNKEQMSPTDEALLQQFWPSFFKLVRCCKWKKVPEAFRPLLAQLIGLASLPGRCTDSRHLAVVEGLPNKENLVFMPNHPCIRHLRDK